MTSLPSTLDKIPISEETEYEGATLEEPRPAVHYKKDVQEMVIREDIIPNLEIAARHKDKYQKTLFRKQAEYWMYRFSITKEMIQAYQERMRT